MNLQKGPMKYSTKRNNIKSEEKNNKKKEYIAASEREKAAAEKFQLGQHADVDQATLAGAALPPEYDVVGVAITCTECKLESINGELPPDSWIAFQNTNSSLEKADKQQGMLLMVSGAPQIIHHSDTILLQSQHPKEKKL